MSNRVEPTSDQRQARLIRREVVLLVFLAAAATASVFLTRAVASYDRQVNVRDAAAWYALSQQQVQAHEIDEAIDSLRRATVKDRDNRRYTIALGRALGAAGQSDEATRVLLKLRESEPEDPETNLELARIAARRRDVSQAVRYYHNAIYGVWAGEEEEAARRRLRVELIRFLLDHGERSNAVAELLSLSANQPDDPSTQVETGQLLLEAGDSQHALDHFVRALRRESHNGAALAGAGEAAFALGDYVGASRYFHESSDLPPRALELSRLADLLLASDPRAPRLTLGERRQRLVAAVVQIARRLDECISRMTGRPAHDRADLDTLRAEVQAFEPKLRPTAMRAEPDIIDLGVELVSRVEHTTAARCGEPTGLDRALLLIGQRYGMLER